MIQTLYFSAQEGSDSTGLFSPVPVNVPENVPEAEAESPSKAGAHPDAMRTCQRTYVGSTVRMVVACHAGTGTGRCTRTGYGVTSTPFPKARYALKFFASSLGSG